MEILKEYKKNLYLATLTLLIVLSLLFTMQFFTELRSYGMMGSGGSNTITLSGYGEVQAVPDIANVSFNISKEAKTVKEAQVMVVKIEKAVLDFLDDNNVDDKDVKTQNFSFNPKYEYKYDTKLVPCNNFICPPRTGKNILIGYEVRERIIVKIRNTDDVGLIIQGLGDLGVTNLNGPNFAIDDEDELKAEARKKAIDNARKKARVLAKDLGVSLGRIVSFSEGGNYINPIMYQATIMRDDTEESSVAQIPKGENTISSNVTITYEIR